MRPELVALWNEVDNCEDCKNSQNRLQHILGGGKELNPNIMFLFINPTYRNTTSKPDYSGLRFPFVGTKEIWNVFISSKLLGKEILQNFDNAKLVITSVSESGFYFTNLVKCTNENADLPKSDRINKKMGLLFKEINIVRPNLIVTFGVLPFEALTGQKLKLSQHYENQKKSNKLITYKSREISGRKYDVWPCYFPVGRGKKKEALELLKMLRNSMK